MKGFRAVKVVVLVTLLVAVVEAAAGGGRFAPRHDGRYDFSNGRQQLRLPLVPREREGERTLGAIGPAHMVAHARDFDFGAAHGALDGRQRDALPRHGRHCCGTIDRSFGWVVMMAMSLSGRCIQRPRFSSCPVPSSFLSGRFSEYFFLFVALRSSWCIQKCGTKKYRVV